MNTQVMLASTSKTYKVKTNLSYVLKQVYLSISNYIHPIFSIFSAFFFFTFLPTLIHANQYTNAMETVSIYPFTTSKIYTSSDH